MDSLSEITRIYDHLGLLAPVTTDLKVLMKYLWLVGVSWNETLLEEAMTSWTQYHRELLLLATLKIHAWLPIQMLHTSYTGLVMTLKKMKKNLLRFCPKEKRETAGFFINQTTYQKLLTVYWLRLRDRLGKKTVLTDHFSTYYRRNG